MKRYVFDKEVFKEAFEFRVGNLYQVAGSQWGPCRVTHLIYGTEGLPIHYGALPDVSQMVTGMPEFKKSMKVHV